MSLATRIESLVIRVAQEFNDVRATAGSLASLSTNDKSSLVAAINELKAAVLSAMAIDDNQIATTSTYSSNKIVSLLDALKADILGGADAAYDTLVEIQQALQDSVADITGYDGYELKRIMRTGTVATIDNRNWELRDQSGPVKRLSQARAIALDMESATIAANGFRFRVPYGTLLCVSDKPLHGELKLPGMASAFYRTQVNQHLKIGILALEKLSAMPPEQLHSRKLRSFFETPFQ